MTNRTMGPAFYGEGKPPKGWKPRDYTEWTGDGGENWGRVGVTTNPIWRPEKQYRLEANHPFYLPDDAALLERLRAQYPGATWPERLPEPEERAVVIAREWRDGWLRATTDRHAAFSTQAAQWIARKLLTEGKIE